MAWRERLTAVAVMAAAGLFLLASPASAMEDEVDITLNSDHENVTAEEFGQQECDGPLSELGANEDGWHFGLPDSSGDAFVSLTLHFTRGVLTNDDVLIIFSDDGSANTGPGWRGFIGEPSAMHAWLITEAGWTLESGTAVVTQDPEKTYTQDFFNLSHTCPGTPTTTTTTTTTTTSTTPPEEELPTTGLALGGLIGTGALLVAGGAALLFLRRRRNATDGQA